MDCTSQTIPFGYLGDFTDDRIALACTPQGGILLHTPKYSETDNIQQRKANFVLDSSGDLNGEMVTTFKGIDYEEREMYGIVQESYTNQVKDMQRLYPINNMEIEKLAFNQDKGPHPVTTENIKLKASEYAAVTDGKIHFLLNPVNRVESAPKMVRNRTTDLYINEGYTDEDEISYTIPSGYRQDTEPLNVSIKNTFGSFTATSTIQGDKLIYKRRLQLIDGTYPKEKYQDFVDFYQAVADADEYDVILAKN